MPKPRADGPKHRRVYASLHHDIQAGRWRRGERLPSEAALVTSFGVSRITVGRALRDLQAAGVVERHAGSGTYVKNRRATGGHAFGLLIPELGDTEIFEPIGRGMMTSPLAHEHALLWGNTAGAGSTKEERAWHLCRQYIERRVSGVFFAPLERLARKDELNEQIARALDEAGIPLVLLDRPLLPYPQPGRHDLVGIDNRHAGYTITDHLLRAGCRKLLFLGLPDAAATVDAREAGFREALYAWNAPFERAFANRMDPSDIEKVRALMELHRPDGVVCANDRTAGRLMHSLLQLEYRIPADVRLVGIDDVEYAGMLPVPLTTLRQPTRELGETALAVMLQRIARPELAPRDTRLHGTLIVRESSHA